MIVVFSPYPYEPLRKDGMYRRILEIDESLLKDEERVYVYYSPQGDDYRISESFSVGTNSRVQLLDFQYTSHQLKLLELINKASFVYAQTMIYSSPYLSAFYSSGKIITDAHGIAAEEERLVGRNSRAKLIEAFEKEAVNGSRAVVVVTEAMADYFRNHYGAYSTKFIHLPISTVNVGLENWNKVKDLVIYSGGLHQWQNVPEMLEVVARKGNEFNFLFLTNSVKELEKLAIKAGVRNKLSIKTVEYEQVFSELKKATFGLLLRDDTPVNNVAFPTKLIEYMACGVVPIIKSDKVGDLKRMGVRYISIDDFIVGRIPNSQDLLDIAKHNYECYANVSKSFKKGLEELKGLVKQIKSEGQKYADEAIALPSSYRMAFLPLTVLFNILKKGECYTFDVDCGETPVKILKTFNPPITGDKLTIEIPNKKFVFDKAVLLVTSEKGSEFELYPSNLKDFKRDSLGNFVFCSNSSYTYKLPQEISIKEIRLEINFLLFGAEVNNIKKAFSQTRTRVLLEKFFFSLRNEKFNVTLERTWRYIQKQLKRN